MKRRIALFALALVLALVGVTAVHSYVGKADARAVAGLDPVEAYVAQGTIPNGMSLKEAVGQGLAKLETLPRKTVPAGAVIQVTPALAGLVATGAVPTGSLLFQSGFGVRQLQKEALPLPKGEMAVTISLGDPQRVGGFVKPGSDIAIFDTYNTLSGLGADGQPVSGNHDTAAGDGLTMGADKEHVTRLLLTHVSVVAIGASVVGAPAITTSSTSATGPSGSTQSSSSSNVLVTVALRQHDAEKLILASQTGTLYFALLNQDSQVAPDSGANNANLFQ
jgi:pilus assembly protein CpaB